VTAPASRLRAADLARVGGAGLRARPLRVVLSALGIAIGIAAMLAVVGISTSSHAQVDRELAKLGTNLLVAAPGKTVFGQDAQLPEQATEMVARIGPVRTASATADLHTAVYRNDHIPVGQTGGLAVRASRVDLLGTVAGELAAGVWLTPVSARLPVVVLGAVAAEQLGIHAPGPRVWLGGQWFGVAGILAPVPLAPELDSSALVGWPAAQTWLAFDGHPTTVYCRTEPAAVAAVRAVLPATANPEHPFEVAVSRPSDALAAQHATDAAFTGLLLGLGAVALLVGGVGVANTMVIAVLERRAEIGLRRALGATRGHVRAQFLAESLLLAALGGAGGVLLGVVVTSGYAAAQGWPTALPAWAPLGGFAATLLIGALAGAYPAARAARLSPTVALAGG
jgi:putative ABC transport system permease protein